ncbi:MAG: Clp protease N-terminal domain-containing protein, partial [Bacteroidota bacterium]
MEAKFSPRVKDVITFSREEALRLGHDYIGTEHLLLGIIRDGEGAAIQILRAHGVSLEELRKAVESSIKKVGKMSINVGNIPLVKQAEKALKITYLEAKMFRSELIGTEHLLLSILKVDDNVASAVLNRFNVSYESVRQEIEKMSTNQDIRSELPSNTGDDEPEDDNAFS